MCKRFKLVVILHLPTDIHNRQFTGCISVFPKQCDPDQVLVFGLIGHCPLIAVANAGRVTVHERRSHHLITKPTIASPVVVTAAGWRCRVRERARESRLNKTSSITSGPFTIMYVNSGQGDNMYYYWHNSCDSDRKCCFLYLISTRITQELEQV